MSEFDPYLKWLGIHEETRPVSHYRLLGVELFESDKDVISMAADRQMSHIRTYQNGPNGKVSQKILNELARARRCLLVDKKKDAYDKKLRATLNAEADEIVGAAAVAPLETISDQIDTRVGQPTIVVAELEFGESNMMVSDANLEVRSDPNARKKTKNREKKQLLLSLMGWIGGGLAALGVGAFLLGTGILGPNRGDETDYVKVNGAKSELVAKGKNDKRETKNENVGKRNGKKSENSKSVVSNKGDTSNNAPPYAATSSNSDAGKNKTSGSSVASPTTPSPETPVIWSVENLGNYPPATENEKILISSLSFARNANGAQAARRIAKLGASSPTTAGTNGVKQEILGLDQVGLLIGMTYTLDRDRSIKTLQPVFRTRASLMFNASRGSRLVIAKPGYAVAEVRASVLTPMNCFRVKFMKMTSFGLDPNDSYFSSRIGREVGPVRAIENPLGAPIVGLYCDFTINKHIQTLGLIGTHKSMAPTTIVAEVVAAKPPKNTAAVDARAPSVSGISVPPEIEGLKKHAIPSSSDRNTAIKEVKKVYRDIITKSEIRDAKESRKNTESLIQDACDSKEAAIQFVMFEAAKEIAIKKGDCPTAMLALRELNRRFDDFDFWDEAVGAVEDSGRSLGRTGDKFMAQELESVLRALIDEAMRSGESRSASKLVSFGLKSASRNNNLQAVQFYKSKDKQVDEVTKLRKQYDNAIVKLAADPENATANVQKGRYLIVVKQDFSAALDCWKHSGDEELLDIVKDESTPNVNASFLARRWQNLGNGTDSLFGHRCYERAIEVLDAAGKNREASDLRKLLDQ